MMRVSLGAVQLSGTETAHRPDCAWVSNVAQPLAQVSVVTTWRGGGKLSVKVWSMLG